MVEFCIFFLFLFSFGFRNGIPIGARGTPPLPEKQSAALRKSKKLTQVCICLSELYFIIYLNWGNVERCGGKLNWLIRRQICSCCLLAISLFCDFAVVGGIQSYSQCSGMFSYYQESFTPYFIQTVAQNSVF